MAQPKLHPGPTLTRWQLTLVMLVSIFGPFSIVVYMTSAVKPKPEEKLPAEYRIELIEWSDSPEVAPVLTRGIRVTNPTNDDWKNVTFSLNKQFFYNHPRPVHSKETVSIPLNRFVAKNGMVPYRPTSQTEELVTIYAQIPSGARAIFEEKVTEKKQ